MNLAGDDGDARGADHALQPSPAVREWLEGVLRERLHDALILTGTLGAWELTLRGGQRRVRIRCDFALFERNSADLPCGRCTALEAIGRPVEWTDMPTPGMESPPAIILEQDDLGCVLHYDVLSLTYWMLSRREEVDARTLDDDGRFPAEASHAWRHGYLERPIVDEWFEVLRRAVALTWPELPLLQTQHTLTLSHDVDAPGRYAFGGPLQLGRAMLADLLRNRDRQGLAQALSIHAASRECIDARDPFNTFDWIMDRSEAAGLRSAFYFICGRTHPSRDADYVPEHPAIMALMQRIHQRGHEIGLHPSYNTYRDPEALRREAERLRAVCERAGIRQDGFGVRMHYLRWETPTTLRAQVAAGLTYDTTLGYAKHPGFRCGTCHEYQAFDPVAGKALKLRLRPLIVMESTVIRDVDAATLPMAEARMLRLMEACRRVRGNFTLLWHNTMLELAEQRRLYDRMLAHYEASTQ